MFRPCFCETEAFHRYWTGKLILQKPFINWMSCGELLNVQSRRVCVSKTSGLLVILLVILAVYSALVLMLLALGVIMWMTTMNGYQILLVEVAIFIIMCLSSAIAYFLVKYVLEKVPVKYIYLKSNSNREKWSRFKIKNTLHSIFSNAFTKKNLSEVIDIAERDVADKKIDASPTLIQYKVLTS